MLRLLLLALILLPLPAAASSTSVTPAEQELGKIAYTLTIIATYLLAVAVILALKARFHRSKALTVAAGITLAIAIACCFAIPVMKEKVWKRHGILSKTEADAIQDYDACVAFARKTVEPAFDEKTCRITVEGGCQNKSFNKPPEPKGGIDLGLDYACAIGTRFGTYTYYR